MLELQHERFGYSLNAALFAQLYPERSSGGFCAAKASALALVFAAQKHRQL